MTTANLPPQASDRARSGISPAVHVSQAQGSAKNVDQASHPAKISSNDKPGVLVQTNTPHKSQPRGYRAVTHRRRSVPRPCRCSCRHRIPRIPECSRKGPSRLPGGRYRRSGHPRLRPCSSPKPRVHHRRHHLVSGRGARRGSIRRMTSRTLTHFLTNPATKVPARRG